MTGGKTEWLVGAGGCLGQESECLGVVVREASECLGEGAGVFGGKMSECMVGQKSGGVGTRRVSAWGRRVSAWGRRVSAWGRRVSAWGRRTRAGRGKSKRYEAGQWVLGSVIAGGE